MADIFHQFIIQAEPSAVFQAISTPGGLQTWWTKRSEGQPGLGEPMRLYFSDKYDWRGVVQKYEPYTRFELLISNADTDWEGTVVGFILKAHGQLTDVEFYHTGWPDVNAHYKISTFCWAMYLRLLRRYVEGGEILPYEIRLERHV